MSKLRKIWEQHYIKVIIGILIIAILITFGLVAFVVHQTNSPQTTEGNRQEVSLDSAGIDKKQQESMTEPEKEYYESGENISEMSKDKLYADQGKAKEFNNTDVALQEVVNLYSNYDFSGVVDYVETLLKSYNLSLGKNTDIAAMYLDACDMLNYDKMTNSTKEQILSQHRNPLSLAIDTIYAYHQRRNAVILDMASISPYFTKGTAVINSYRELDSTSEVYQKYSNIIKDYSIKRMWEIQMSFPDANGTCYAIENGVGDYLIIGYYGQDLSDNYSSQSYWNSLGRDADSPQLD